MKKYNRNDTLAHQASILEDGRETFRHGDGRFPCASYLDCYSGGRGRYPWHWHDELEIAYVERGEVTAAVNDRQVLLQQGDGIFINRRVLHAFFMQGEGEARMPNILFHPALLYGTQESVFWEKYVKPLVLSNGFTHAVFRRQVPWQKAALEEAAAAFRALTDEKFGYEIRTRSALSFILLLLLEKEGEAISRPAKSQAETDRIRQMLSFIRLHYTQPIRVQQIADSAFISRRECMRVFRNIIGLSPIQYVIGLRVQKAKQLLLETDRPILDICVSCGFQNQSYFTKVFREKTGLSPLQCRKAGR